MYQKAVFRKATQKRPYIKPLPYHVIISETEQQPHYNTVDDKWLVNFMNTQVGFVGMTRQGTLPLGFYNADRSIKNACLEKFDDDVARSADMLVAFVERTETVRELITKPLSSLLTLARGIRRRDPRLVRKAIAFHRKDGRDVTQIVKKPSGLWLAYWFGILPTISDIQHAIRLFEAPSFQSVKTRSSGPYAIESFSKVEGSYNYQFYGTIYHKLSADVYLVDHRRGLAAELGLTSPLRAVHELVPWSWAVDYFFNIGQLLSNLDGKYAGLRFENVCHSHTIDFEGRVYVTPYQLASWNINTWACGQTGTHFQRKTVLPSFDAVFHGLSELSGQRISYLLAALSHQLKAIGKN